MQEPLRAPQPVKKTALPTPTPLIRVKGFGLISTNSRRRVVMKINA